MDEVWIALIGVAGTAGAPWITATLQNKRAERDAKRAEKAELRSTLRDATHAFLDARIGLDQALTGVGHQTLDSVTLYVPLAKYADEIGLLVGGQHPMAKAYREAVERWAEALNLARAGSPQANAQAIADARNSAEQAKVRFLELAAPHVGTTLQEQPALRTPPSG
jgi:hypothetical protein